MNPHHPTKHHLDRRVDAMLRECDPDLAPDDVLTTREVADWLGMSVQWIEIGRSKGYGPPFLQLGNRYIRYRRADVVEWLKSRSRKITSEYVKRPSEAAEQPAAAPSEA